MLQLLVPFTAAALYLIGGQWWKPARWFMGAAIGALAWHGWIPLVLATIAYFVATNVFSYGEKMWTTKLFGPWISMALSGLTLGAASFTLIPWPLAIAQTVISTIGFLVLKWLDDTDKLKNPWQELLRGFIGTICYFIPCS